MEEQSTAIILARATELRLKIRSSVTTTTTTSSLVTSPGIGGDRSTVDENGDVGYSGTGSRRIEADAEEDEEAVGLLNICDALESLENQLSSLQVMLLVGLFKPSTPCFTAMFNDIVRIFRRDLQQRQRYEKEAALSEIEHSRKILLDKLQEYKGKNLEVLHEASAFAGETVHRNQDLMLPPYPTLPPLGNGYLLHGPSGHKSASKATKEPAESERKHSKTDSKNSNRLGSFVGVAAKSVLTIVGIVSILHLSGFRPKFGGKVAALKALDIFQQSAGGTNGTHNECPPGKILVMEGGEARCIVKERIEVPFSSVVGKPDVNYGSG